MHAALTVRVGAALSQKIYAYDAKHVPRWGQQALCSARMNKDCKISSFFSCFAIPLRIQNSTKFRQTFSHVGNVNMLLNVTNSLNFMLLSKFCLCFASIVQNSPNFMIFVQNFRYLYRELRKDQNLLILKFSGILQRIVLNFLEMIFEKLDKNSQN